MVKGFVFKNTDIRRNPFKHFQFLKRIKRGLIFVQFFVNIVFAYDCSFLVIFHQAILPGILKSKA
jgi:hypothetical protein